MADKTFHCHNPETIQVKLTSPGVDHKAVYLCDQCKIHWKKTGNVKDFEVVFDTPGPFGSTTKFGTLPGDFGDTTSAYNAPADLTVYKYTITIWDTGGVKHGPFDPHVVGGGG
jgi:hypothetical protein